MNEEKEDWWRFSSAEERPPSPKSSPQGEDLLRSLLPFQDQRMDGSRGFAESGKFKPGLDRRANGFYFKAAL
jgi:hypothetical protein